MAEPVERYLRFTLSDRLEHWAQILTFVPLAVTGLVQRYAEAPLSRGIIKLLGGVEATRIIHRVFAAVLMLAVVYHLGAIGYRRFVLAKRREMGVNRRDLRAATGTVAYILGRRDHRPEQGRYTFEEKIEYWSLVWGTVLMIVTGFMLWNPIATTNLLPGQFIPAARSIHGFEALLAVLAIVVWHIYHVHVRHFNRSMFSGYVSREEMEHYHPLELAAIENDPLTTLEQEELQRRRLRYLPSFGAAGIVLLGGLYLFVTFEDTAIETIEPIEGPVVFAPVTTTTVPISTTDAASTTGTDAASDTTTTGTPTAAGSGWEAIAAILEPRCGVCHGAAQDLGRLDLSSYESTLAGGVSGPAVVPGDPDASLLVVRMASSHPRRLTDEELAAVTTWIASGAPGPAGEASTGTAVGEGAGWGDFTTMLADQCGACHGAGGPIAELDLSTYATAVAGGTTGPGIVPGDPDASQLIITQLAGGHPGQLSDEDIAALTAWIAAGAPEA